MSGPARLVVGSDRRTALGTGTSRLAVGVAGRTILGAAGSRAHGGAFLVAVNSPVPSPNCTDPSPRVVIVDESDECREVLHTLLASRGVPAIAARGAREGLELMRQHHPDVVVLDLDAEEADDDCVRDAFDSEALQHHTALVVLGKARRYLAALPDGQVLAKPYHYAPLLRTIERLLAQ